MRNSEKKIIKKTINICKSVKNAIGKFSYEYDYDFDFEEDEDSEDDCYLGDKFLDVLRAQHERLNNHYVTVDDFLDDYDGEYEEEINQAKMNIDLASEEINYIIVHFSTWNGPGTYNSEIITAVEYLDEAIEYLEGCLDEDC